MASADRITTKEKIVHAYISAVAEYGWHKVTYELLGQKIGKTKTLVHYHFKNLDDLSVYAVRYYAEKGQSATEHATTGKVFWVHKLKGIIDGVYGLLKAHPDMAAVMALSYYQAIYDEKYQAFYREVRITGQERLSEVIVESWGMNQRNEQSDELARNMQNFIFGSLVDYAARGNPNWGEWCEVTKDTVVSMALAKFLKLG